MIKNKEKGEFYLSWEKGGEHLNENPISTIDDAIKAARSIGGKDVKITRVYTYDLGGTIIDISVPVNGDPSC